LSKPIGETGYANFSSNLLGTRTRYKRYGMAVLLHCVAKPTAKYSY
jgi:hypothetical protein